MLLLKGKKHKIGAEFEMWLIAEQFCPQLCLLNWCLQKHDIISLSFMQISEELTAVSCLTGNK